MLTQKDWLYHRDRKHVQTQVYPVTREPSFAYVEKEASKSQEQVGRGVSRGSGGRPPGRNKAARTTETADPSEVRNYLLWKKVSHELIRGT